MKSKKLISFLCAAAMTASAFAGLAVTASAAVGDELHKSDFEAVASKETEEYKAPVWNDDKTAAAEKVVDRVKAWDGGWGAATGQPAVYYGSAADAATYMTNVIGSQKVDDKTVWTDDYATFKAATVTPPSVVGTKSLYFATQIGMNPAATELTIAPAVKTSASGVYGVAFDMMLVNADHQHPNFEGDNKKDRTYNVALGGVKLSVTNENLSYYDENTAVDTGIDLTLAGTWFHFDLVYDAENKQYKGTITPYDGDDLVEDSAVTIPWAKFNGSATTITTFSWQNERNDGANKGAANGAIDNVVVTERAATEYKDVSVKLMCGETLLDTKTANAEVGTTFTAGPAYKVDFATEASKEAGKYYTYDAESTTSDSVEVAEGAEVVLQFAEVDMVSTSIKAVIGAREIGTIATVTGIPGEKQTVYASEYMKGTDEKWYQYNANRTNNRGNLYDYTIEVGTDAGTVQYTYANDVEIFMEAESGEGTMTVSGVTNAYPITNASGGSWVQSETVGNYPKGFTTEAVSKAGKYTVSVRIRGDMKRTVNVYKVPVEGDMVLVEEIPSAEGLHLDTTAEVELAEGEKIHVGKISETGGSKLIDTVDYIVVKNADVKAIPVPNVVMTMNDNVVTMTSDVMGEGVLIHAEYAGDKLSSIKAIKNVDLKENEAVTETLENLVVGDKIMLWDAVNGMTPLAKAIVSESGATQAPTQAPTTDPTQEPTTDPTQEPTQEPTYAVTVAEGITGGTVTADKTADLSAGDTVTLTVIPADKYVLDTITVTDADGAKVELGEGNTFTMPAANVTVTATFKAVTYTVKGTVDANVTSVTLKDKADAENTLTATIAEGVATFTNVKEATYTISARYATGFEKDTITPAEITVTANNDEAFAITSKASTKPAISGTVAIEGTPDVGVELTATVTGLNDGATAVYEWESADAENGPYAAIANATAATYTVPQTMNGKYIKVVVTTDDTSGHIESTAVKVPEKYTVTITQPTGGTVAVAKTGEGTPAVSDGDKLVVGDTFTVTATPTADTMYRLKKVVVKQGNTELTATEGVYTMPKGNITITAEFMLPTATFTSLQYKYGVTTGEGDEAKTYNVPLFVQVETYVYE